MLLLRRRKKIPGGRRSSGLCRISTSSAGLEAGLSKLQDLGQSVQWLLVVEVPSGELGQRVSRQGQSHQVPLGRPQGPDLGPSPDQAVQQVM